MTAMTAFLRKTGHGSGKEEKRPQWRLYNERSRRGWYSDTPLKTDARGDALEFPPTTFDNISDIDCLVFCRPDNPSKPTSHHKIDDDFERALDRAGIAAQERKTRVLSFHSWRHFANSVSARGTACYFTSGRSVLGS